MNIKLSNMIIILSFYQYLPCFSECLWANVLYQSYRDIEEEINHSQKNQWENHHIYYGVCGNEGPAFQLKEPIFFIYLSTSLKIQFLS